MSVSVEGSCRYVECLEERRSSSHTLLLQRSRAQSTSFHTTRKVKKQSASALLRPTDTTLPLFASEPLWDGSPRTVRDPRRRAAFEDEHHPRRKADEDLDRDLARVLQRIEERKRRHDDSVRSTSVRHSRQRDGGESLPPKKMARRDLGPKYRPVAYSTLELLDVDEAELRSLCDGKPIWMQGLLDECARADKHLKTNRRCKLETEALHGRAEVYQAQLRTIRRANDVPLPQKPFAHAVPPTRAPSIPQIPGFRPLAAHSLPPPQPHPCLRNPILTRYQSH